MRSSTLIGRDREVRELFGLLDTVTGGQGAVLLVTGEPGIGKSSLLDVTVARAGDLGFRVLRTSGVESETHLPFGGLQQLLSPLMGRMECLPVALREGLATALGLFDGARPDLFLIAEAADRLLAQERGTRSVLVAADDVQWLDPQSHQILTFLAHRAPAAGLVVVAAARAGHPGSFAEAAFPTLVVEGVDEDAAQAIVELNARDLAPADRRRVQREARGNPLALLELPAVWTSDRPGDDQPPALSRRLEHAFAGRATQLPPATRDALLVAATDSTDDVREILLAVGAFGSGPTTVEVFGPAVAAGLVTDDAVTLTFRHPLVRSAVLQAETVARRQAAHRALSRVLDDDAFRRTWHRAQSIAGRDDAVAEELESTVPESLSRGAVMSAVWSLERAAQLTSSSQARGRRLLLGAVHAFDIGRADVVARLVREAASENLSDTDRVRRTWLLESLDDDVRADPGRVVDLCDAARLAAAAGAVDLALDVLVAAALRCWWADVGLEARSELIRTLDGLASHRDDHRHLCALALAEPIGQGARVTARLAELDFDSMTDGDVLRTYGMAAYGIGDLVLATDILDRTERILQDQRQLGLLTVVLALQFHIRLDLGDWSGSAAAAEEVARVAVETGQALFAFNNVLVEARALALRGSWRAALELVVGAESEAARLRLNDALCLSYQSRGTALLSADRPDEAFDVLRRPFDPGDPGFHRRESFSGIAIMAEAAAASGNHAAARAIVAGLEEDATTTPSPMLRVNLLVARAVLADPGSAEALHQDAMAADLTRWPWARARVRLEYGLWLCAEQRGPEARPVLEEAHDVFARMGALRWRHRAATALRALAEVDDPRLRDGGSS